MRPNIAKFKPGAPVVVHLVLAASLWTIIGGALLFRGLFLIVQQEQYIFLIPGVLFGWCKSLFILDSTAVKNVGRIMTLGDGTCLGAVFSKKTWLLVFFMAMLGVATRHSSLPRDIVGALCIAIGFSLVFSSRHAWSAWYKNR